MYSLSFLRGGEQETDSDARPQRPILHGYEPVPSQSGGLVEATENRRPSRNQSRSLSQDADDTDAATLAYLQARQDSSFCSRWENGDFTISPEGNPYLETWDCLVLVALAITALYLPFQVAVLQDSPSMLRAVDLCIDMIFTLDIILTFNVAYEVNADIYERNPVKIFQHYLAFPFSDNFTAGWFWPDVMTVIPWEKVLGWTAGSAFKGNASLRLVRVLRLARMLRLMRVVKLFQRWHTAWGFPIAWVNVGKCMGMTLLLCHWIACVFCAVALNSTQESWFSFWQTHFGDNKAIEDCSVWEVYNTALYFTFSTLTSVGFGDMLPQSQMEILMTSVSMLVLGVTWAYVLATIVNVITNTDICSTQTNMAMDDLNLLMESRDLSNSLRRRSRKHLHEAFNVHRLRHQQRTIRWLSTGLQGEIAIESGVDKVCNCIWYLRNLSASVIIDIAQYFNADMFSPNEFILDRFSVCVIRRGICTLRGATLSRDAVIGEDFILASDELRDSSCPRTITFVELMSLQRADLLTVCEKHPDFNRRLRKAQIRLAVWRGFIHAGQLARKKRLICGFTRTLSRSAGTAFAQAGDGGGIEGADDPLSYRSLTGSMAIVARIPGFAESIRAVPLWTGQSDLARLIDQVMEVKKRVDEGVATVSSGFEDVHRHLESLDKRSKGLVDRRRGLGFCTRGID